MKEYCVNGHKFTPENTRYAPRPNGKQARICKACNRNRVRAHRGLPPIEPEPAQITVDDIEAAWLELQQEED